MINIHTDGEGDHVSGIGLSGGDIIIDAAGVDLRSVHTKRTVRARCTLSEGVQHAYPQSCGHLSREGILQASGGAGLDLHHSRGGRWKSSARQAIADVASLARACASSGARLHTGCCNGSTSRTKLP